MHQPLKTKKNKLQEFQSKKPPKLQIEWKNKEPKFANVLLFIGNLVC